MTDDEGLDRPEPVRGDPARPDDQAPPLEPARPDYKGAPLDPERGPGLGCFWLQTVVFLILFVLTPYGVINGWPAWLTTTMFIATLILLLFVGQTVIFLLRLVAADRRARRRPLRAGASATVGDLATMSRGGAAAGAAAGGDAPTQEEPATGEDADAAVATRWPVTTDDAEAAAGAGDAAGPEEATGGAEPDGPASMRQ